MAKNELDQLLLELLEQFRDERDWAQFAMTPRILHSLCLIEVAGAFNELFSLEKRS